MSKGKTVPKLLLIKLFGCALYSSFVNVKQNSSIQAQFGEELEAQPFVTGVRQAANWRRRHLGELQEDLELSRYKDTVICRRSVESWRARSTSVGRDVRKLKIQTVSSVSNPLRKDFGYPSHTAVA